MKASTSLRKNEKLRKLLPNSWLNKNRILFGPSYVIYLLISSPLEKSPSADPSKQNPVINSNMLSQRTHPRIKTRLEPINPSKLPSTIRTPSIMVLAPEIHSFWISESYLIFRSGSVCPSSAVIDRRKLPDIPFVKWKLAHPSFGSGRALANLKVI